MPVARPPLKESDLPQIVEQALYYLVARPVSYWRSPPGVKVVRAYVQVAIEVTCYPHNPRTYVDALLRAGDPTSFTVSPSRNESG